MIYLTGDTHRDFGRIKTFSDKMGTTKSDVLIILGDAGINYYANPQRPYSNKNDIVLKKYISTLPITLFCIHGNHEIRPSNLPEYHLTRWHEGEVWIEDEYPNIVFAKDGEIYEFNGKKCIAIGGAYSIDKFYRLAMGYSWWNDEQPSEDIKKYVEKQLSDGNWKIHVVFSHTVPLKYEPIEMFLSGVNQSTVDKSTEEWLDSIESRLDYNAWYAGHYHTTKTVDKLHILFNDYQILDF